MSTCPFKKTWAGYENLVEICLKGEERRRLFKDSVRFLFLKLKFKHCFHVRSVENTDQI